jgi:DNA repair protein SbcD/Mre11
MRILHTSDWHIGRRLHGESLAASHENFLNWLHSEVIAQTKPELLVVSGDIYDRGVPPTEAIELFEDTLAEINKYGIQVLITSGNHDSRVRLGSNTRFMSGLGLHFRTRLHEIDKPVVVPSDDFDLLAYGIPYLEPDVDAGQWQVEASQSAVLAEAMRLINADVENRKKQSSKSLRVLVATHAFVEGATKSDSERNIKDIRVGGLGQTSAAVFAGADYVAMGHIHRPHSKNEIKGPGSTLLRYSGSPIPFSFSERDDEKQVLQIEISKDGVKDSGIETLTAPKLRGMKQIEGTMEELISDKHPATKDWLKVVLTDKEIPINVFDTLKRKFENLLDLETRVTTDGVVGRNQDGVLLQNLTPEEVTRRFVVRVTKEEASEQVASAIDDCCADVRLSLTQVNK